MPNYDYKCAECGNIFTLSHERTAERKGYQCTQCGGTETKRLYTFAVGVTKKSPADFCPSARSCSHAGSCGCGH